MFLAFTVLCYSCIKEIAYKLLRPTWWVQMGNSDYISRIMLVFNMTGERGVGKGGGGGSIIANSWTSSWLTYLYFS